jgi:hypothetical protein
MKTINFKPALIIILLSFLIGSNQACNQKSEEVIDDLQAKKAKPESIMGYYKSFTQAADGKFTLKSYTTFASQDDLEAGSNRLDGFFFDKDGKTIVGGDVQIGNIKLKADTKNSNCYCSDYEVRNVGKDLHGTKIKISVQPSTGSNLRTAADSVGAEIYVPKLVKIIEPSKFESSADQPFLPLKVGGRIAWDIDVKNEKGIVILLEYDPVSMENKFLQDKGQLINGKSKKAKALTLKDTDGQYTFSNDDFKEFPANAVVNVTIGRANFATLNGKETSYTFFAYTVVVSPFQIKK